MNLEDNLIDYGGSRFIASALKVNKSLRHISLKLNRLDDKAGSKLCNDLEQNGVIKVPKIGLLKLPNLPKCLNELVFEQFR